MGMRQTSGSVVCPSCGRLAGVKEPRCQNCGRPYPGMWGFSGLLRSLGSDLGAVPLILGGCGLLYLISVVLDPSGFFKGGLLGIGAPTGPSLLLLGASGSVPVFDLGRWWTVLSAAWLHGSILHIVFNMMWVRDLGRLTAQAYGGGRMMIIYTVSAITGFSASTLVGEYLPFMPSFLAGAPFTVGASAPLFGLLGALLYYGRRSGSVQLSNQIKSWAVILLVFGLVMPRVDNWAHLGGLAGGYLVARWLDPLKPERIDHLIAGLVCILLSLASIAASVLHGLPILRAEGLL